MKDLLQKILDNKRREIETARKEKSILELQFSIRERRPPRDFRASIRRPAPETPLRLIAEMKKASPSAGVIREAYDPAAIAREYERNGADALSILTDRQFFQGAPSHITEVVRWGRTPVLRKDFILDEYQLYETRVLGADAVLLIVRILTDAELRRFIQLTKQLGLSALVEVHDEAELERALSARADTIGINHRNLDTLKIDLDLTRRLKPRIPRGKTVVAESGMKRQTDFETMKTLGVDAVLVGESLLTSNDLGEAIRAIKA